MKSLISILLIAALTLVIGYFLPWWSLVIPCALYGFLYGQRPGRSFRNAFGGVAICWMATAAVIQLTSGSELPFMVAGLFPGSSVVVIYLLTGLTGGLTGGFAALTGYLGRRVI